MTIYKSNTTERVVTGRVLVGYVILVGGSANSSIILNDSTDGTGGKDIIELKALANDSKVFTPLKPIEFTEGIYNTLSGTGAKVYIQVL